MGCKIAACPCDALSWHRSTGSRPTATGIDVIYRKKKKRTSERHIHMKKGTVQTRLTYFLSTSGRINLHDDSFQK